MAKRSKGKVVGSRVSVARKPSAPNPVYTFHCKGHITTSKGQIVNFEKTFFDIKLPCNLAELAIEAANAAFTLCEELAFKAGIDFLPAKEIIIVEEKIIEPAKEIPF